MTSTHSTHHSNSVSSTSSQLASHAKTSARRANRQDFEKAHAVACSTGLCRLLGVFDLSTSSSKMLPIPSVTATVKPSNKSLWKLPKAGTMLSEALYQLQTWEPVTYANASGLLPTPTTQDTIAHPNAKLTPNGRRLSSSGTSHSLNIQDKLTLLPTPRASEWKGIGVKGSPSSLRWAKQGYLTGVVQESDSVPTGEPMHLNPCFVEEMMGYPVGWTDLNA